MTSFAFILGCVPLWVATGAGSVGRQIMGTTVIGGMLAATMIAIFIIPALYVIVERLAGLRSNMHRYRRELPSRVQWRRTNVKKTIACFILTILAFGCTVGPDYSRPKVEVPGVYRATGARGGEERNRPRTRRTGPAAAPSPDGGQPGAAPDGQSPQPAAQSFGDQKWWDVFQDPQLQQLIRTALQQNYDVRIAVTRILQAQAVLGITRADQLPTVNAGASATNDRFPRQKLAPDYEDSATSVNASVFWALDFWGKYRRATEAARANLLATEWARRAVISTLVSNVAASYFQLRSDDLQLEIARRTLESRRESLALTRTLQEGGAGTMLDVRQAEQLVAVAAESIPELERRIHQQENFISTLLGNNPGPVDRGTDADRSTAPAGRSGRNTLPPAGAAP